MSRSYKKTPISKDNCNGRKRAKRQANKKVRHTKFLSNGKEYRKVYNTWDIYDYVCFCTLEEFLNYQHLRAFYQSEEERIQAWRRGFYLK